MVSILSEEMSYASHAARSSPTAVVKENGKETRLCVPHCRRKLGDELPPVELTEPRNREVSPRQRAINALQEAIQDREGLEQRINAVSLTFYIYIYMSVLRLT